MPEGGQPSDLALRVGEMAALQVGLGRRPVQASIDIREPRALRCLGFRLVFSHLSRLLLACQIDGEGRELLVAGFPQRAQLKEHQGAEAGLRIAE